MRSLIYPRRAFRRLHLDRKTCRQAGHEYPEIQFGLIDMNDRWICSVSVRWVTHHGVSEPVLRVAGEGWRFMPVARKWLVTMAQVDSTRVTEDRFALILADNGFMDVTQY